MEDREVKAGRSRIPSPHESVRAGRRFVEVPERQPAFADPPAGALEAIAAFCRARGLAFEHAGMREGERVK